jgi:hypothetical protein
MNHSQNIQKRVPCSGPDDRAHEGLVVEAGRKQLAGQLVGRADIEGERRKAVLALGHQPVEDLDRGGRDVGLAHAVLEDGDQRVRLVDAGGENAARAVILEGAADRLTPLASSAEASVSPGWPTSGGRRR